MSPLANRDASQPHTLTSLLAVMTNTPVDESVDDTQVLFGAMCERCHARLVQAHTEPRGRCQFCGVGQTGHGLPTTDSITATDSVTTSASSSDTATATATATASGPPAALLPDESSVDDAKSAAPVADDGLAAPSVAASASSSHLVAIDDQPVTLGVIMRAMSTMQQQRAKDVADFQQLQSAFSESQKRSEQLEQQVSESKQQLEQTVDESKQHSQQLEKSVAELETNVQLLQSEKNALNTVVDANQLQLGVMSQDLDNDACSLALLNTTSCLQRILRRLLIADVGAVQIADHDSILRHPRYLEWRAGGNPLNCTAGLRDRLHNSLLALNDPRNHVAHPDKLLLDEWQVAGGQPRFSLALLRGFFVRAQRSRHFQAASLSWSRRPAAFEKFFECH